MIGKPIALLQVPNQRLFGPQAASQYLGIDTDSLKKYTHLGQLKAYDFNGRRAYRLEDLDSLIDNLPEWEDSRGEKPAKVTRKEMFA